MRRQTPTRWPLATLAILLCTLLPALGRATPEGPPLNMADAVTTALQRNRDVIAARLDIETAQLDRLAASIYPNPTFSYTMSNIVLGEANPQYPPIPQPGAFGQLQHNLSLSEVVDIWAKRSARMRSAELGIAKAKSLLYEMPSI